MEFLMKEAMKTAEELGTNIEGLFEGPIIKVIGVGGAGSNMVSWLYTKGVEGAEIIAANTDVKHLRTTQAHKKILLGPNTRKGLGAGGYPEAGAEAAKESIAELKESLKGADMVFICAGMGGGTGTGAAPIVAEIAKQQGSIVIGVVTMPFKMEGNRMEKAEVGLANLRRFCHTVIVIDNNKLLDLAGNLPLKRAFDLANEIIAIMIQGIVETIQLPSFVQLDFADVKAIMSEGGLSVIGIGESDSERKSEEAVQRALKHPLLPVDYSGGKGALIQVTAGPDFKLEELNLIGETVKKQLSEEAQVIWGARIKDDMEGRVRVITIITGVKSPYIMGKDEDFELQSLKSKKSDLGIDEIF